MYIYMFICIHVLIYIYIQMHTSTYFGIYRRQTSRRSIRTPVKLSADSPKYFSPVAFVSSQNKTHCPAISFSRAALPPNDAIPAGGGDAIPAGRGTRPGCRSAGEIPAGSAGEGGGGKSSGVVVVVVGVYWQFSGNVVVGRGEGACC